MSKAKFKANKLQHFFDSNSFLIDNSGSLTEFETKHGLKTQNYMTLQVKNYIRK